MRHSQAQLWLMSFITSTPLISSLLSSVLSVLACLTDAVLNTTGQTEQPLARSIAFPSTLDPPFDPIPDPEALLFALIVPGCFHT